MSEPVSLSAVPDNAIEVVPIDAVKPHPRNYQGHPDDEIEHIIESIKANGLYRNVVIARDGTLLAGHGVVQAARKMGLKEIPVVRLDLSPYEPKALKVLTGDNEISHLAERDDRLLSELLKEINEQDVSGLLGTGYDGMMLANLVMVTRHEHEIADINEAAEWVGLPDYEPKIEPLKLTISFENEEARDQFVEETGLQVVKRDNKTWSTWWPAREAFDAASARFISGEGETEAGG